MSNCQIKIPTVDRKVYRYSATLFHSYATQLGYTGSFYMFAIQGLGNAGSGGSADPLNLELRSEIAHGAYVGLGSK